MADMIDISAFVSALPPMPEKELAELEAAALSAADAINGSLKAMQDFTVTINWDTRPQCGVCQQRFSPGPEGLPVLTSESPRIRLIACTACAVALATSPTP